MKKLLVLLSIILCIQCKSTDQKTQTEVPKVTTATYHKEVAGLKNAAPQIVYELVFSEPFSQDFQVKNCFINEKEKKVVIHPSGKISLYESTSSFPDDNVKPNYKVRISYNNKLFELEGVFEKKNTIYRP